MTRKLILAVWLALLALTAIEVWLAYVKTPQVMMLTILVSLSVAKAAMIIAYFMHLKYERATIYRTLIPVTVAFILMLFAFLPDAVRTAEMHK